MNMSNPLDDTLVYNQTGLVSCNSFPGPYCGSQSVQEEMMRYKSGSIWGGYLTPWDKFVFGVTVGQKYLMENTTLGIPSMFQSEGTFSMLRYTCDCSDLRAR